MSKWDLVWLIVGFLVLTLGVVLIGVGTFITADHERITGLVFCVVGLMFMKADRP